MPATSTPRTTSKDTTRAHLALVVADANWFTTENLFREVDRPDVSTLLLSCIDYRNAWVRGAPPWRWGRPLTRQRDRLWRRDLVLPSGWMKQFPHLGMRPIRRAIAQWRDHCPDGARLGLVMTYPHYLYLRDLVRPDVNIYFNIDDYSQYWPRCADRVNELERQAVRESALTICVSKVRCDELRQLVPEAAGRIHHLPHGTPRALLADEPQYRPAPLPDDLAHLPRPCLGYVGTLEDRIDWPLMIEVAKRFPQASIVLVGRVPAGRAGAWQDDARRCLAMPNVHLVGWRSQEELARYNRAFDVCLIPYRADHPFNRVSCPTKIMDYMATGRPIVSTDLPECRLHEDLFDVTDSTESFLHAIAAHLGGPPDDAKIAARFAWATENRCSNVVERFLDWLPPE
jgi:glycosyltransferase involved in cell wall biosynthesis